MALLEDLPNMLETTCGSIVYSMPMIHDVSALTHAHTRSKVGCGICTFILSRLLDEASFESVWQGLSDAAEYYIPAGVK